MDTGINKFYIDLAKVTFIEGDEVKRLVFNNTTLNNEIVEKIRELTFSTKLCTMSLENEEDCLSMVINRNNLLTHIGVVNLYDDEIYYFDNNSNSTKLIEIGGNFYEEWSICSDFSLVWDCIITFILNGKRIDTVNWKEDEM